MLVVPNVAILTARYRAKQTVVTGWSWPHGLLKANRR
jgi:hypothetical protein